MKSSVILILVLRNVFCEENGFLEDFVCGRSDDAMGTVEFYCSGFTGVHPPDCLTSISYDKSKIKHLKMGGCDIKDVMNCLEECPNLLSMDISYSGINFIDWTSLNLENEHLEKLNASHNQINIFPRTFISKMSNLIEMDFSWREVTTFYSWNYHDEGKKRIVLNSGKEGLFYNKTDGKEELHCSSMSFENMDMIGIGSEQIENANDMLECLSPSLRYLEITGTFLERFNFQLLERFKNLESIEISKTELQSVDLDVIKDCENLRTFKLTSNNLKTILNLSILEHFTNLQYVYLINPLENMTDLIGYLNPMTLSYLDITNSFVGKLNSTTFEGFTELSSLYLTNTSLSLDDMKVFEPLEKLEYLDLSDNNLENTNITSMVNRQLSWLTLKNTNLSLDNLKPFESLTGLETFDISYNNLENTNFTSSPLKTVESFDISYCQTSNISEMIKQLELFVDLNTLNIAGHYLDKLNEDTFGHLKGLRSLNLDHTNVSHVDYDFVNRQKISSLNLANNGLKTLNIPLSGMPYIEVLELQGNDLTEMKLFSKANFPLLSVLDIEMNQLPCEDLIAYDQAMKYKYATNINSDIWKQKHGKDCAYEKSLIERFNSVRTNLSKLTVRARRP